MLGLEGRERIWIWANLLDYGGELYKAIHFMWIFLKVHLKQTFTLFYDQYRQVGVSHYHIRKIYYGSFINKLLFLFLFFIKWNYMHFILASCQAVTDICTSRHLNELTFFFYLQNNFTFFSESDQRSQPSIITKAICLLNGPYFVLEMWMFFYFR